jgi:hypothetical protein
MQMAREETPLVAVFPFMRRLMPGKPGNVKS